MAATHPDVLLEDSSKISEILVDALKQGVLSVFVGAGISMSTSKPLLPGGVIEKPIFPSWANLVKTCCVKVGLPFDDNQSFQNEYLLRTAESVETYCKDNCIAFHEVVEGALYSNCADYDPKLLKLDLLIALGSLVMTSTRGNASVVVNYNFDDLLEWYLIMHGFTVTVVSELPTLAKRADVFIYHPHGFLPKLPKLKHFRQEALIFSKRSYQKAYNESSPWNEFQKARFGCNLCLFLGLSGDDEHIEWLYSNAFDQLHGKRIVGVVVLFDNKENRAKQEQNKRRGVIHYYIASYDDLPDLILSICRQAAGA